VPDPIARFDRRLRHVYVNRATALADNRPVSDFHRATMADLGHAPEVCDRIETNLKLVFETGEARSFEVEFFGPQGQRFYETQMAPEFGADGKVEHVVVISRNITAQRITQIALLENERMEEKSRLVAQLAHEINNPLMSATLILYLMLRNGTLDMETKRLALMLTEQVLRITEVSRDILSTTSDAA
jgi:signal transduction histidine kinase